MMEAFEKKFSEQCQARRGRPRRKPETVKANVRLSVSVYDALCRQALSERVSLHSVMQRALTRVAESIQPERR